MWWVPSSPILFTGYPNLLFLLIICRYLNQVILFSVLLVVGVLGVGFLLFLKPIPEEEENKRGAGDAKNNLDAKEDEGGCWSTLKVSTG